MIPNNLRELAEMIAKRDGISYDEAAIMVKETAMEMEEAFMDGSIIEAEDILASSLGLEPDYLDLFIM